MRPGKGLHEQRYDDGDGDENAVTDRGGTTVRSRVQPLEAMGRPVDRWIPVIEA
jgi:hypothetical protein